MIIEIDVPALQWLALVHRLMSVGYLESADAWDMARLQVGECGARVVSYLLTCEDEEIRRMARGFSILVHGA